MKVKFESTHLNSKPEAGRDFVPKMLEKFGEIDDGEPDAPAPLMSRVVKGTKKSPEDFDALQHWASTAPDGAEKEFQAGLCTFFWGDVQ